MTECLDMMDLLQSQKSSHTKIRTNQHQLKESNHQVTNTSIQKSVKSQKSQRSKRSINSNATRKSDQVEIAYFRTLKARRNSSSSISSTQSLENSLLTMEKRFKKHNQQKPDMTDQKYLISTFVQMNADYKKVILIIKSYMQTLKGVLSDYKVKDDQVWRVDGFFQKHADILQVKIQDYFKIKECLHKLIKMKIQEPYAQRVKDRIRQVEKHNKLFEVLRVYIEAFRFVDIQGFEYFKEDIELMEELKRPPQDEKIGEIFDEQITSIIQQIETTKDTQEGEILSKVFEYKLELILKWKDIILDVMTFRYAFNIRYNLSNTTEKIMKSKKIYERVLQHTEKIKQFMITYYSLPKSYLEQVESIQNELNLMKSQVIQWNIKLMNEQKYKDLLPLLKFNMMLKRAIKQLQNLTKLKHQKKYEIQATEIIIQVQMNHQAMKDQLIKFYRSPEMKNDEFLQKQFNKSHRKGIVFSVPQMQGSYQIKHHLGILVGPCQEQRQYVYKKFMSGSGMRNSLMNISDDQIIQSLINKEINTLFIVIPCASLWEMREAVRPYVITFREYHRKLCLIITKMEPNIGADYHFNILSYFRINRHIFMRSDISSQELRDAVNANILNEPVTIDGKNLEIQHIINKPENPQQNLNLFSFPMKFDKFIGLPSPEDSITHQPIQRQHDELSQSSKSSISSRRSTHSSQSSNNSKYMEFKPKTSRIPQIDEIDEEEIEDVPKERYPLLILLLLLLAISLYVIY